MVPKPAHTLVVDIGGTGIKMITLGPDGQPVNGRVRALTPQPADPEGVLATCAVMAGGQPDFDRVSVGFPGVVQGGVVRSAPNLGTEAWADHDLAASLGALLGKPVRVLNDADLQGYGVISGEGVELVLTLGTGMGAALFTGGRLVPNLELGRHPHRKGNSYEELVGNEGRRASGKRRWQKRVATMLESVQTLFNCDQIHLGGGNAKHLIAPDLPPHVRLFTNEEGMRGGARLWNV